MLGGHVAVVLHHLVSVAADLQRVVSAGRGQTLHHVSGVLDAQLGLLVRQQQRRAVIGGYPVSPDVDRGLAGAGAADREPYRAPVQRPDQRGRVVVPSGVVAARAGTRTAPARGPAPVLSAPPSQYPSWERSRPEAGWLSDSA